MRADALRRAAQHVVGLRDDRQEVTDAGQQRCERTSDNGRREYRDETCARRVPRPRPSCRATRRGGAAGAEGIPPWHTLYRTDLINLKTAKALGLTIPPTPMIAQQLCPVLPLCYQTTPHEGVQGPPASTPVRRVSAGLDRPGFAQVGRRRKALLYAPGINCSISAA